MPVEATMSSSLTIFLSDRQSSVLASRVDREQRSIQYTPYGYTEPSVSPTTVGYTGQLREKNFDWYMLGNGHRIYNPKLKRFHSPDHLSPFDRGGINSYAYVNNDPMNLIDPEGLAGKELWAVASSVALMKSGVSLVHGGIKAIKSFGTNHPNAVVEITGHVLKTSGDLVSATASGVKLARTLREMDPTYAGVDDRGSDIGLATAYIVGQIMSGVGDGLLLGLTGADLLRGFFARRRDAENRHQAEVNQQLLQQPPDPLRLDGLPMPLDNRGVRGLGQEVVDVRMERN